jgi:hypothetical protein
VEIMNWKKVILIVAVSVFALAFFTVAAVGFAATAALGTAAVAISESGVVEAFEEVAAGAGRLQVNVAENSLTVTNLDSGESVGVAGEGGGHVALGVPEITVTESGDGAGQIVIADPDGGRGELQLNLPGITIDETADGSRVILSDPERGSGRIEFDLPGVSVTEGENGAGRVVIRELDGRSPRLALDGEFNWDGARVTYGPGYWLRPVGQFFSAMFTLVVLVLIAAGAFLLLRRRQQRETVDPLKGENNS